MRTKKAELGPKSKLGDVLVDEFSACILVEDGGAPHGGGIQCCTLLISPSNQLEMRDLIRGQQRPGHISGAYDLNLLLRDLPLSQLEKYKVNTERPPKPKQVKKQ